MPAGKAPDRRLRRRSIRTAVTVGTIASTAAVVAFGFRAWRLESADNAGGFPPFDTLKPVGDDIWIVDGAPIRAMGLSVPIRMTVVRLSNGDLLLHSPIQWSRELAGALKRLGNIRFLVAPSIGHWQFVEKWQQNCHDAEVWAVPGLRERRKVRRSGLRIDHDLGAEAPSEWAADVEQGLVCAAMFQEAWFVYRQTRTLLLTDLVENMDATKLPGISAAAMRLAMATKGTTPLHVRAAVLLGGRKAVASVRRLIALRPERVIFAHGRWFESDGAERLKHALSWAS